MKGRCVICARIGKLTRDHVPPRGAVRPSPLSVRRLTDMLGGDPAQETPRGAYQAPEFPSLCRECNEDRLGTLYDPQLIALTKAFAVWMRAATSEAIILPRFPNSMNRKAVSGDQLKALAISIGGLECDQEAYESTHTDPQLSVMVGLDRETLWTSDGRRTGPDLYGSSGCGLWRYGRYIQTSMGPPKLSAIGIEWHRKGRHRHVLGTRIPLVINAIADKYPAVRELVSKHQLA